MPATITHADLHAVLVEVLCGQAGGTAAQAAECNPTFGALHAALPELLATLPAGQYLLVDLEQGPPPAEYPLFAVEDGTPYPANVYMEWASSQELARGPTQLFGSYNANYSMANTVTTPHGPGLSLGLGGSPMNSALSMWVLPAACWPTPEQLAPLKAEYLAAVAEANAAIAQWQAEQAAKHGE